jgi:hypothetical protein
MGACDTGRCCKGGQCTNDKKCCCTAGKKGTHTAGEVCRTSSCQYEGGNCDDDVNVCECESNGGTLSQSCDPCANVVCDATQCKQCVNGVCVSTCTVCQQCINGVCTPITCPACQSCVSGLCVSYGDPCGFPVTCCSDGECCVNGVCVPEACNPPCGDCYTCVCGECVLTGECATSAGCSGGATCVDCQCVPPSCCVFVPDCAPHGVIVIEGDYTCETVTYDYQGSPCTEVRTALDCASASCAYQWDGSAWSLVGCSVQTSQGTLVFQNDDCCSSTGCPATLADAYSADTYKFGISCENPLP